MKHSEYSAPNLSFFAFAVIYTTRAPTPTATSLTSNKVIIRIKNTIFFLNFKNPRA